MSQQVQIRKEWMPSAVAEFQAVVKPREYADLLQCKSPKFLPFMDRYGRVALEEIFARAIMELSEGLGQSVSGSMVGDAVDLIIDDYPDTKLSDILMFKRDVLSGKVGGQVGDNIWKWNTRAILQAWGEYYAKREDVFCEAREQRINEEKRAYQNGLVEAYRNASPETKKMIQETTAKLEKLAEDKRAKYEESKQIIPTKLTLEEIAVSEGIDLNALAEAIQQKAEARQEKAPIALRLSVEMAETTFKARQNPKYLHELINQNV